MSNHIENPSYAGDSTSNQETLKTPEELAQALITEYCSLPLDANVRNPFMSKNYLVICRGLGAIEAKDKAALLHTMFDIFTKGSAAAQTSEFAFFVQAFDAWEKGLQAYRDKAKQ